MFEDPNLKDLVVHEGDSMEEIHFGKIWLIQSNKGKTIMRIILKA